jgi:hypothetical protein
VAAVLHQQTPINSRITIRGRNTETLLNILQVRQIINTLLNLMKTSLLDQTPLQKKILLLN